VNTSSRNVKRRVYNATKEFLFVTLYLWVIFGLFAIYRSVILAEHHVSFRAKSFALINALALAKVMVTAKELRFGELFHEAPLIFPTITKSVSFSTFACQFQDYRRGCGWSVSREVSSRQHCELGWRHVARHPLSDAAALCYAHSLLRLYRAATGFR